jgi:hypothetical protein
MTEKKQQKTAIWLRRVVPAGWARATLVLEGTAPLLMNSADYDRMSDTYRAYKLLGAKRGKSIDDEARLAELEWALALMLDEEIGPYIPGKNIWELLRSAATKFRKGEEIKRSLAVLDYRIPLLYDGPRDQAALWKEGFQFTTMVANAGAGSGRVPRCRPKFEGWSLAIDLAYDPEDLDYDLLGAVAERSMKYGLGDYRPLYGAFEATLGPVEITKAASNGSAFKPRIREAVLAHLAFVERIMGPAVAV